MKIYLLDKNPQMITMWKLYFADLMKSAGNEIENAGRN